MSHARAVCSAAAVCAALPASPSWHASLTSARIRDVMSASLAAGLFRWLKSVKTGWVGPECQNLMGWPRVSKQDGLAQSVKTGWVGSIVSKQDGLACVPDRHCTHLRMRLACLPALRAKAVRPTTAPSLDRAVRTRASGAGAAVATGPECGMHKRGSKSANTTTPLPCRPRARPSCVPMATAEDATGCETGTCKRSAWIRFGIQSMIPPRSADPLQGRCRSRAL
eukprot:353459-Chlamydomonas_euryale.AAC.4